MATAEKKRPRGSGGEEKRPSRKEVNMEEPYGIEWPSEEKVKRRQMVAPEARYIFVEPSAQGKGLGKFLMELIELIACKSQMGAVMLTVQKANNLAMAFYMKLRYVISSTSPSRVDPLIGLEKNYKILCKTFESEAKSKFELKMDPGLRAIGFGVEVLHISARSNGADGVLGDETA
uniref:N-alpha-acetyltransferase 40 n=1 Tax=Leersia perrieri TaxID=77586 RepID=A0A0D9VLL9_9ORYZ